MPTYRVHNGQRFLSVDVRTAAVEWTASIDRPVQCSRSLVWHVSRGHAYVLGMLDRQIVKWDADNGRVVASVTVPYPVGAFILNPISSGGQARSVIYANGNGTGVLDPDSLTWFWDRQTPPEGYERGATFLDFDGDDVLDVLKPWDKGGAILFSGSSGKILREFGARPDNEFLGIVRRPAGDVIVQRDRSVGDFLDVRGDRTAFRLRLQGFLGAIPTRSRVFTLCDQGRNARLFEISLRDGRTGASLDIPQAATASGHVMATDDLVAIAAGTRIEAWRADLRLSLGGYDLGSPIEKLIANEAFSTTAVLTLTRDGRLVLVDWAPALRSVADRSSDP